MRKLLGVKSRDRVTFRVTEGRVDLAPAQMTLEAAYGAVKPTSHPKDWPAIRTQAREERVRRRVRKISHMKRMQIKTIISYDWDFDRFQNIKRREP